MRITWITNLTWIKFSLFEDLGVDTVFTEEVDLYLFVDDASTNPLLSFDGRPRLPFLSGSLSSLFPPIFSSPVAGGGGALASDAILIKLLK